MLTAAEKKISKTATDFNFSTKFRRDWIASKKFYLEALPLSKLCSGGYDGNFEGAPKTNKIIVEINKNKLKGSGASWYTPSIIVLTGRDALREAKEKGQTHCSCWLGEKAAGLSLFAAKPVKVKAPKKQVHVQHVEEVVIQREYMHNVEEALRMYVYAMQCGRWIQRIYDKNFPVPAEDRHGAAEAAIVVKESAYKNIVIMDFLCWQLTQLAKTDITKLVNGREHTMHGFTIVGDPNDPSTWFGAIDPKQSMLFMLNRNTPALVM